MEQERFEEIVKDPLIPITRDYLKKLLELLDSLEVREETVDTSEES